MIRVLIAEDEPLIAESIAILVNNHQAFSVVGVASNGIEALDELKKESIDVVITDIRMPGMDGLELLKVIYSKYPDIYTIIISGYQEFSYAQTAITYQAFDYLLKPISRDSLFKVLNRLELSCNIKLHEKKQRLVQDSAWGQNPHDDISGCTVLLMCAGPLPNIGGSYLTPGQVFWDEISLEAYLRNIISCPFIVFYGKHHGERVLVLESGTNPVEDDTIRRIYTKIIGKAQEISITIIGHALPVPMSQVGDVIRRLQFVLYNEMLLYRSKLIWRDCIGGTGGTAADSLDISTENIIYSLSTKDSKGLSKALTKALDRIYAEGGTQQELMRILDLIVGDARLSSSLSTQSYSALKYELSEAVANNTDIPSLINDWQTVLEAASGDESEKRETRHIIDEIELYLQENYAQPITLKALSRQFGFVPSYLTRKFREYKNMSPNQYLLRIRMQKARQLLEDNPDILIKEIAHLVGYSDHNYFSKQFKKENGYWPSEHRKKKFD